MKRIFSILSFIYGGLQFLEAVFFLAYSHRLRVPSLIMGSFFLGIGFWLRNMDRREKAVRSQVGNSDNPSSAAGKTMKAYREFRGIAEEFKKLVFITGFLSLLNYVWGAMVRDWTRAGYPISSDFLFLFMLTLPLMILDALCVIGIFRRPENRIWAVMLASAYLAAVLSGYIFGLPNPT